jgi:SAM-dependent methyltransferase
MAADKRKKIKEWWENPKTISLLDLNLRELETEFVASNLSKNDLFADFGCGDGISTCRYAKLVRHCFALEESKFLYEKFKNNIKKQEISNIELQRGTIENIGIRKDLRGKFTAVCTQRVVINFMSWKDQQRILEGIHATLRPGGRYIALENTFEGFEELNSVRRVVGLENIILHDWHNYFLHRKKFLDFMAPMFHLEKEEHFDLYYFLTRVFTNMFAKFEGFGSNAKKDAIFEVADYAARLLFSKFRDKVKIQTAGESSFGPIQGWVFRKIG